MKKLILVLGVLGILCFAGGANALTLTLDDTSIAGIEVTLADNAAGDSNLLWGVVTYSGNLGGASAWIVNVTTGLSKPILGQAAMDLNSINVTSSGGGTLIISLSDAGFTLPSNLNPISDTMEIGGTTQGKVTYDKWIGTDEFQQTTKIGTLGQYGPGAFSGTLTGQFANPGTFSMTQIVTIVHTNGDAARTTSFDASNYTTAVPEPATMLLLGSGLLGLAGFARKRFKK